MKKNKPNYDDYYSYFLSPVLVFSSYVVSVFLYLLLYWLACVLQYSECKLYEKQSLSNFLYEDPRYAAPTAIFGVLAVFAQRAIQMAFEYHMRLDIKNIIIVERVKVDRDALYVTLESFGWLSVIGTISYLCASSVSSSLNAVYNTFHSGAVILTYLSKTVWTFGAYVSLQDAFNKKQLFFVWSLLSLLLSFSSGIFMILRLFDVEVATSFPGNLYFPYMETAVIIADVITTTYVYLITRS